MAMENERKVTKEEIKEYLEWMKIEGKSKNTRDKYRRDLNNLREFLNGRSLSKASVSEWKNDLQNHYAATSVNSMLAAANGFFKWLGLKELEMGYLKIQRKLFCDQNKELEKSDYDKLVAAARMLQKIRLMLLLETICGLGLRVSEVQYITVEAARCGRAEIVMKGKVRTVMIAGKLAKKLLRYAGEQKIETGEIFITRSGKSLSRSQIWREMKSLCEVAGVEPAKVFPHNLRHLFARTYYNIYSDISKLADVLGHSSVETTRIYLISSGEEHARQLEQLGLVS
ncbi:MAG: tyrosine-type recombinase/integrase [Lachnospiraceae bacterium]|nr:tyrosine-type recombinase/integrase [Lachnospiraceae bacterium]